MYIVKCGNCTPLGERAGVTAASVRAGFSAISISEKFEDEAWEPVRLGLAEYMNEYLNIEEQFQELAYSALKEVVSFFPENNIRVAQIPLIVGLPEGRPGLPTQLSKSLEQKLFEASKNVNIPFSMDFILQGHTSCLSALEQARNRLESNEFCVVGGVDSYDDKGTIQWLEKSIKRLFCSTTDDGFVPGQAAGFVLLASEETVSKHQLSPFAKILSIASDEESNNYDTGKNSTSGALTKTIKRVLEVIPEDTQIDEVYSTQNGEKYSAIEYAYSIANVGARLKEVSNMVAPYTCWGDLGAASVPVLFGLMTEAGKKGYAKGPLNLVAAANLGTQRASALVELLNLN